MEVITTTLEVGFVVLVVYTLIYCTGLLINVLPDIIDSIIYLIEYLKDLKDSKKK